MTSNHTILKGSFDDTTSHVSVQNNCSQKPTLLPSPGFGSWLHEQGGSLVFSTYQTGRIFFLSGKDNGETVALERTVGSAMGLAVDHEKIWISNKERIWRFANIGPHSLKNREKTSKQFYDAVFMPRSGFFIGPCDTHDILADIDFENNHYELLFVNTNFSCIASIDEHYNFVPVWKPDFISALCPGDRCHLNGMGARNGQLAYATVCGKSDVGHGWKTMKSGGGMLIDVQTNQIVCDGLSMPHSPRWHENKIWLLNSGEAEFGYVDLSDKRFTPVVDCPGFARGLQIIGNHAVIGLSCLRENTFASGLRIKEKLESRHIQQHCGLIVVNLKSGRIVHWITINGNITELYDIALLPGCLRPFTPGFRPPNAGYDLVNIPNDRFPLLAPD